MSSFRKRLSYGLALLFVFVSFNPAQARMMMGQGVMGVGTMAIGDAAVPTGTVLNSFSLHHRKTGESSHHHPMAINMDNMSTTGDCQSECDCCPGLCSVYLPNNVAASNFPPSNLALAESAFQGTVGTRTRLFRPPISH